MAEDDAYAPGRCAGRRLEPEGRGVVDGRFPLGVEGEADGEELRARPRKIGYELEETKMAEGIA